MKKFLLAVSFIIVAVLIWYLFIKQYDYQFRTSAKNSPGILFSEISDWKKFTTANDAPNDIYLINRRPFKSITQRIKVDSSSYFQMQWELDRKNDTITALSVNVLSTKNTVANRWSIINPFRKSIYLDSLKGRFLAFQQKLRNQQNYYKVQIESELSFTPKTTCVCSTSTNVEIANKAVAMVNTIDNLENYVLERDLQLNGYPFLKVTAWDREQDLIDFQFCFPVHSELDLVKTERLTIEEYPSIPSLKAVFNGNYRLSHIAWYELLYIADQRNIENSGLPLEVFHNNPKTEENPTAWTAEIYLPVVD